VQFAPDGRVFVGQKNGQIKVFAGVSATTPSNVYDLSTNVYNFWDRALTGLALAPTFPADPSIYVAYAYDHVLGDRRPPQMGDARSAQRPVPDAAWADGGWLCRERSGLACHPDRRQQFLERRARRGLVPTIPVAHHGHARLRTGRRASTRPAAKVPATTMPTGGKPATTAVIPPAPAVRRSPRHSRGRCSAGTGPADQR
jgi:hypothetical protein